MSHRSNIPKPIRNELLVKSKHRCNLCQENPVEIHHINGKPNDHREINLIVLCCNCHTRADRREFAPAQLRMYKKAWIKKCDVFGDDAKRLYREMRESEKKHKKSEMELRYIKQKLKYMEGCM